MKNPWFRLWVVWSRFKNQENKWLRLWMVWSRFNNHEKQMASAMDGMVSLQKDIRYQLKIIENH